MAQGNDTIGSLTAGSNGPVEISYQWFGEPGHELNNITFELLSGTAGASVVEDILGIHYSESAGTSLTLPGDMAYPAGDYFVRMNATIFNGATQVGSTTNLSNTFAIAGPKCAVPWTPVSSVTGPGYTPLRFESPSGSVVQLSGPNSGVDFSLATRDVSYQIEGLSMTVEVFSVDTGVSAGVQTVMRGNCTSINPNNPGSFVLVSDNFFIVPSSAQVGQCPGNSTSASSAPASVPTSASSATASVLSSAVPVGGSSGTPISQSTTGTTSSPLPTGTSPSAPANNGGPLHRRTITTVLSWSVSVLVVIITVM
ncbi:hypothetical protein C8R45DRAFT_1090730 [Mycena sanguinolenta]|nr:hypothetical protein C8R45DRAFT_1090730 [Mycena sanguinolenta]